MDEWILDRSRDEGGGRQNTKDARVLYSGRKAARERRSLVWLGGARLSPSIWVGSAAVAGAVRSYEGDAHPCQSKSFLAEFYLIIKQSTADK